MSSAVSQMRFIGLACILLHHSFCVYQGWPPNLNITLGLPKSFLLISTICKCFGLIAFCFISGMLVYYSLNGIKKNMSSYESWRIFVIKKFRRLIVPATIWGGVFAIFFGNYAFDIFPHFINGTHLWFLPMLFLLMLAVSPMMFNKYLVIVPVAIFCWFYLHSYSRTTSEFVTYFPAFISGYFFSALMCKHSSYKLILAGLVIVIGIIAYCKINFGYALYLSSVIASVLLLQILAPKTSGFFNYRPVKFAIKHSFTIYILHQFVIILLSLLEISFLAVASVPGILIYFAISFVVSMAIAQLFSILSVRYRIVQYLF